MDEKKIIIKSANKKQATCVPAFAEHNEMKVNTHYSE